MNRGQTRSASIAVVCSIAFLFTFKAVALDAIKVGQAEIIRNEVLSINGTETNAVSVGDDVLRDEVLKTNADSDAKIILLDETKLSLGPSSTLKIDRAVYSGENHYREITIRLTDGAFRFITGSSDKKSYKIVTPLSTIGVRGTILDILVSPDRTLVSLQEGAASVCANSKCVQLLQQGHTADVSKIGGATNVTRNLVPTWTFASVCSGNQSLCAPIPNALKKVDIPSTLPSKATDLSKALGACPAGQVMLGGVCSPSGGIANTLRADKLRAPAVNSPVDREAGGQPQLSSPNLGAPSIGVPSLPKLGR